MKRTWSGFAALIGVFACINAAAQTQVPANLTPPAGNVESFRFQARGSQIYTAMEDPANPGSFIWVFKAPLATLYLNGSPKGQHYGGPTWEYKDGSKVVGKKIASAASATAGSIPQLLLQAVSHSGRGAFSEISYIQRLNTVGGIAPAAPPVSADDEADVPYTATYVFFHAAGS